MTFKSEFALGEIVYQRVTQDRSPGMVVSVMFDLGGGVQYKVCWGSGASIDYYPAELTRVYLPEFIDGRETCDQGDARGTDRVSEPA